MLGKILNLGKKKEFYLTLEETQETGSTVAELPTEVAAETATEAPTEAPTEVAEAPTEVTEVIESAPVPEAEAKPEPKSTKTKGSKKRAKAKSKVTAKPPSEKKPAAPAYSGASSWEEPFWVKAMYNSSGSNTGNGTDTESEKTFATDYLLVQSSSRRRPGPSIDKFKNMVGKKKF